MNEKLSKLLSIGSDEITRENYREYPAINKSLLAALDTHPSKLLVEDKETTNGMRRGTLVDILVYDGTSAALEHFYVSKEGISPSDNIKAIIHYIFSEKGRKGDHTDDDIVEAAEVIGYGQSWNKSTLVERVKREGGPYYDMLVASENKIVISKEEWLTAIQMANIVRTSKFTSYYFTSSPDQTLYTQVPLLGKLQVNGEQVPIKGLIDGIVVDHSAKTVSPYDLKTHGGYIGGFEYSFFQYRYDLQAALYSELVRQNIDQFASQEYDIETFRFVVVSESDKKALRFTPEQFLIERALCSWYFRKQKLYIGVKPLISDLIWHIKTDNFDFPKEVYDNDGEVKIEV